MRKKKIRKTALCFFIVSIVAWPLIVMFSSFLNMFPILLNLITIILLLVFCGGFIGSIILFVISLFIKEKESEMFGAKLIKKEPEVMEKRIYCPRCGAPMFGNSIKEFNGKAYCSSCEAYYSSRFEVVNGKLIDRQTRAELLNEVVIHKRPLHTCYGDTAVTDFIINLFSDRTEIVWGIGWRGGSSHADGANGCEILPADFFDVQSVDDFIEFLNSKKWGDIFLKSFDIRNNQKIKSLFKGIDASNSTENENVVKIAEYYDRGVMEFYFELYKSGSVLKLKETSYGYNSKQENILGIIDVPKEADSLEKIIGFISENIPSEYNVDLNSLKENRKLIDFLEKNKTLYAEKSNNSNYKFDWKTIVGPKDEDLKKQFNPNICDLEEPIYFSNGKIKEKELHLGTYWRNRGDYEQVTLKKADDGWYVCSVAMWPVHRGASNGGYSETKLEQSYFVRNDIKSADDFVACELRGNCKPCVELIRKDSECINMIDEICKGLYISSSEMEK